MSLSSIVVCAYDFAGSSSTSVLVVVKEREMQLLVLMNCELCTYNARVYASIKLRVDSMK